MISGIKKPLIELNKNGYYLFIVSNQPDISRGNIKKGTIEKINKIILKELPVKEIYTCPHEDFHNCKCRKPKPGMILELAERWKIDLKKSFIIGDNWKDMKAGEVAGCITILLDTDYNKEVDADYRVKDIKSASLIIKSIS